MNLLKNIADMLLHFSTFSGILCAVVLLIFLNKGDRSRLFLAITFGISGVMVLTDSMLSITQANPYGEALSITKIVMGFASLFMLYLYPIEVINPRWLNLKKVAAIFSPLILMLLWIAIFEPEFRTLNSLVDVMDYSSESNVIIRLVLLAVIIPLSFLLFYVQYNWSSSRVDYRWIMLYSIGLHGIAILYVLYMLTASTYFVILHQAYCMAFMLIITYQEIFIRMPVDINSNGIIDLPKIERVVVNAKTAQSSPIWDRLTKVMEKESLWRNPDLTLIELASTIGTNRTTLSNLIREEGYENFYSFINSFRIKEFLFLINNCEVKNLHETFYDVGFRSKTTAIRYFRKETGTTPSEYLQRKLLNMND